MKPWNSTPVPGVIWLATLAVLFAGCAKSDDVYAGSEDMWQMETGQFSYIFDGGGSLDITIHEAEAPRTLGFPPGWLISLEGDSEDAPLVIGGSLGLRYFVSPCVDLGLVWPGDGQDSMHSSATAFVWQGIPPFAVIAQQETADLDADKVDGMLLEPSGEPFFGDSDVYPIRYLGADEWVPARYDANTATVFGRPAGKPDAYFESQLTMEYEQPGIPSRITHTPLGSLELSEALDRQPSRLECGPPRAPDVVPVDPWVPPAVSPTQFPVEDAVDLARNTPSLLRFHELMAQESARIITWEYQSTGLSSHDSLWTFTAVGPNNQAIKVVCQGNSNGMTPAAGVCTESSASAEFDTMTSVQAIDRPSAPMNVYEEHASAPMTRWKYTVDDNLPRLVLDGPGGSLRWNMRQDLPAAASENVSTGIWSALTPT